MDRGLRRWATVACILILAVAGLVAGQNGAWAATPKVDGAKAANAAQPVAWPSYRDQLLRDRIAPDSALAKLIAKNQDFSLLRPEELKDSLRIPLWLRVLYHKNHPEEQARPGDPTGGYPFVLKEVAEWMVTHQDLQPPKLGPLTPSASVAERTASETGEERISGAQTSPRSESDIRVNYLNPQKIIGASNNISSTGRQAMFFSSNGGVTWGNTLLPLVTGDSFMSDPTVEWTSDGTAWSTTIGINAAETVLQMRAYKSTDGGATWTFDNTFSTGNNNDKQIIWVDHSATSSFKDHLYAIWHNGAPAFIARRTGPTGSWQAPVQISGSETTGTAIGDDVKTNSFGDVFGFFPDTGSRRLNVVKSTNGGASFGAPVRIATSFGSFEFAIPADASRECLVYITGGAYRTSTVNNVYAVWADLSGDSGCTSGSGPGTNAASTCKSRIFFSRSTDGGSTWSTPVKFNNQSGLNDQFFPWMVVDETNGKIAVSYYDTVGDSTRKSANLYYQSSTDNGTTWSTPFKVTTVATNETTTGADSGNQYGDYTGLSGINGTFFPSWTDRRSGASEEIWTAAIQDSTSATPDFTISASPSSTSIAQGSSGNVTINTSVSGGFSNSISLSATGQPSGVSVTFSPNPIAAPGSGSSTMGITVASTVAAGTYTITVTGTGGSTTHTTPVSLTVTNPASPDFTISASPTSKSIAQGANSTVTITTAVSGGFNNSISLSATGQPSGVTVAFSPNPIAAPGSGSSTMTITVGSTVATGTYTITVMGTGGSTSHTTPVSLTVTTGGTCTNTTLYSNTFETGSGLSDWTKGTFVSGGSTTDWRGIQVCSPTTSGTHIFHYGGSGCTSAYASNDFTFAQPKGATGIAFGAAATTSRLTFKHRYSFESGFDGGTLAVSVDGTNYTIVPSTAILSGGYNGTIDPTCPPAGAAGAPSWTGSHNTSFTSTTVDLDAACNAATGLTTGCAGKSVFIAFTSISDCSVTSTGWFLDDVTVTDCQ